MKKVTAMEMRDLGLLESKARVFYMGPQNMRGFALFYTYYFTDSFAYEHADFHYEVMEVLWKMVQHKIRKETLTMEELQRFINELLFIGFRECAKTTMFKAFLLYVICYEIAHYINVDAYDKTNAERILFDLVYQMQTNKKIIEDFGHLYTAERSKEETTQKRVTDFLTNKIIDENGKRSGEIRVEAHSTNSPIRGRQHNSQRPDLLWLEDFETEETITSEAKTAQIAKHIASFKGGLADTGHMIIYSANYLTEYGNVQTQIDRAKVTPSMKMFLIPVYTEEGTEKIIAWPEKYVMTKEQAFGTRKVSIEQKKISMWTPEKGDTSFITEMLCKPIDETTQEFKKKMFKYITWQELQMIHTVLYITIDSGGSSKETQRRKNGEVDDTGICFNFVDEYGNWYIKAYGRKMDAKEIMEFIFNNHLTYQNLEFQAIEETMFVEAIKPFFDQAKKDRGQYPLLRMLKAGGRNKENRIRGLQPRMEAGTVYFIEGECSQLEDQLLRFPRAKHDDVADATAYQNDVAKPANPSRIRPGQPKLNEREENRSPYSILGL